MSETTKKSSVAFQSLGLSVISSFDAHDGTPFCAASEHMAPLEFPRLRSRQAWNGG